MDHKVTGDRCYSHITTVEQEMTKKQVLGENKRSNGASAESQGENYVHMHTYSAHMLTR